MKNRCSFCGEITDELATVDDKLLCQMCFVMCSEDDIDLGDVDKCADYILKHFK